MKTRQFDSLELSRFTFAAALLASGLVGGALGIAWGTLAPAPLACTTTTTLNAPEPPAFSTQAASASATASRSGAAVSSGTASAASQAEPQDTPEPHVGSEGFGAHVMRALESRNASDALQAAQWIASCRTSLDMEGMLQGSHPNGYRIEISDAERRQWIEKERRKLQNCLTLTPDLMAKHKELALRALQAELPGSAKAYSDSLGENATADERARALQALREAVKAGDPMALLSLLKPSSDLPRVEAIAYRLLVKRVADLGLLPALPLGVDLMMSTTPAPASAELVDAEARVRALLPAFLAQKRAS